MKKILNSKLGLLIHFLISFVILSGIYYYQVKSNLISNKNAEQVTNYLDKKIGRTTSSSATSESKVLDSSAPKSKKHKRKQH